jgi:homoserine dehydrogenase
MKAIRIGLLGCGTVGGGVIQLLHENATYLAETVGAPLEVARVLVRDEKKDRVPQLDRKLVTTDPEALLGDASIDVFVEVMGGVDPARQYVERALDAKREVVTANKMLLAMHGPALLDRAVKNGVDLAFEGSVGGGIPVIRVLRDAFASDWVQRLEGIVNGTCNFVLTRMRDDGLSFDAAVKEAQAKGYAEADPGLDVDGHDAAHKLVVLAMLAFGARVDAAAVPTEGIRAIHPIDHRFAARFGYTIKHLAIGRDHGDAVELRVHPALVARDTAIANVNGVLNAISLEGRALGPCLLSGRGAGDMPTAVSVVADVLDVARARLGGITGTATRSIQMQARPVKPLGDVRCRYYLHFQVHDRPGVLARIAGALGEAGVSIEQMVQEGGGGSSGEPVDIVLLTHEALERELRRALDAIVASGVAAAAPRLIRILDSGVTPRLRSA